MTHQEGSRRRAESLVDNDRVLTCIVTAYRQSFEAIRERECHIGIGVEILVPRATACYRLNITRGIYKDRIAPFRCNTITESTIIDIIGGRFIQTVDSYILTCCIYDCATVDVGTYRAISHLKGIGIIIEASSNTILRNSGNFYFVDIDTLRRIIHHNIVDINGTIISGGRTVFNSDIIILIIIA